MNVRARAIALALMAISVSSHPTAGQSHVDLPDVFRLLAGEWSGEGTLLGRPAVFTMRWEESSASERRLDFTNGFQDAAGTVTPVLKAVAFYTVGPAGTVVARWTDNRPQDISIVAEAADSVLVSDWTAPSERGRTEYRVMPDGSLRVRDWVGPEGALTLFGEALYRRSNRED